MKGLVLELKDGFAAVLCENGAVMKIQRDCQVGDTIELEQNELEQMNREADMENMEAERETTAPETEDRLSAFSAIINRSLEKIKRRFQPESATTDPVTQNNNNLENNQDYWVIMFI